MTRQFQRERQGDVVKTGGGRVVSRRISMAAGFWIVNMSSGRSIPSFVFCLFFFK